VSSRHPDAPKASGFHLDFTPLETNGPALEISLLARRSGGEPFELIKRTFPSPQSWRAALAAAERSTTTSLGPLPKPVMALVEHLQSGITGARDHEEHERLVDQVKLAATMMPSVGTCPTLTNYIRFLCSCWNHFRFVARYFPAANSGRASGDKDWNCKQNSPQGLMSIAHHLYVLKSYDVAGDFAEFGCFKGYSSAMLSHACRLIGGLKMHIFDSFEGLPPSDSKYYRAGDFTGSMPEVSDNLRVFGCLEVVKMHQGFFSDSVPKSIERLPSLAAIWMDVDLATSAKDVLPMISKLDPRGALFSHESPEPHFANGAVHPLSPSPDNVVVPIVECFGAGRLAGRHIVGSHGSFWKKETGIPVLSNQALMALLQAVS
jgi:O-methyltransferase